jgi:predicted alpha/beta superfamily hydrolase
MVRRVLATLLLILVSSVAAAIAMAWYLDRDVLPEGAVAFSLPSAVLGESREAIVYLPEGYEQGGETRYPVIYVLDGSSQAGHTTKSAALLARIGMMPEAIVVGIPHVNDSRNRDYTPPFGAQDEEASDGPTGQADRFLAFLKTELIPEVDRRYRTTPRRALSGWSRGGLFVVYSLIADPALFDARFAHSPALWRDDTAIADHLRRFLAGSPAPTYLYLSMGSREVERMQAGLASVHEVLRSTPSPVRWAVDLVPGAVHQTNGEWATPRGFHAYYRSH